MMVKKFMLVLLLLPFAALPVEAGAAEKLIHRRVSGKVVATDTQATPNTIVVKVGSGKEALIVGADVTGKTVIRMGKRAIKLGDLKTGEMVSMAYTRDDYVVATSIKTHKAHKAAHKAKKAM